MAVINANPSNIDAAISGGKLGDTIVAAPGTYLRTGPLPLLPAPMMTVMGYGALFRMQLRPIIYTNYELLFAAMEKLGFSGEWQKLDPSQQAAVNAYIKATPPDVTGIRAAIAAFRATLKPVTDRLWDAKPIRKGEVTYNGKIFIPSINWGANLSKGIITTKLNIYGTHIEGVEFENGRMEGSSYNAAAIRGEGFGVSAFSCAFRDCENGVLSTYPQAIANPAGDWFREDMIAKHDVFGYNFTKRCTEDNCGAGGNAHGTYSGLSLATVAIENHVIRSNNGNGIKSSGGPQLALGNTVDDTTDSGGLVTAIDMDSGVGYIINNTVTKNSAGGGTNYGPVVLMRNYRDPNPAWLPQRFVVRGNVITDTLNHPSSFVMAQNLTQYNYQSVWTGTPQPIVGIVTDNVFRCPAGSQIRPTPVKVPAGFDVQRNVLLDMSAPIPDTRIPLPNYDWTLKSFRDDLRDVIFKVDPEGAAQGWNDKIRSLQTFPNGASVPAPTPIPPPPQPVPVPVPVPGPTPVPTPVPVPTDQEKIMALEKQIADMETAAAALVTQSRADVADAEAKRLAVEDKLATFRAEVLAAAQRAA